MATPTPTPAPAPAAPPYKLIYWPGLPGRGEPIRLAFEEAGVAYEDTAHDAAAAVPQVLAQIREDNLGDDAGNPPPLAPPVLVHGALTVAQLPNILLYLGPRLGLVPADDALAVYRVNALALTALDGLSDEVHDCHHPICTSLFYEDQRVEARRRSARFVAGRLPKFLGYFERVLAGNAQRTGSSAAGLLYGAALTYADLVLFHCVDGVAFMFPRAVARLRASGHYARVFAHHAAVRQRPNIAAYLASDRRQAYSNGIYRYYEELDVVPEAAPADAA